MDLETYKSMCHGLAKAYSTAVRLYEGEASLYSYSVYHMHPDPLAPYLRRILDAEAEAGIIATPLYQLYGFLTLEGGLRMILGPTRALQDDGRAMDELLATLGIRQEDRENYARLLLGVPSISADRFAWLLASLATALRGKTFPVEDVWLEIRPESSHVSVRAGYTRQRLDVSDDPDIRQTIHQSYAVEQLVMSYIETGQPELLRELFSAPPYIAAGRMAQDGLRQMKNMGICTATGASRAAIAGGLDPQQAFHMSDLYIQKLELTRDIPTMERLMLEMMLDFAEQTEKLRAPSGSESRFYRMCARYVSQNIFSPIRAEQMANALGYTRAHLCTRFKKETGTSLTHYIQQEKVAEAKRLLRFTDQDLGQIAAIFGFSSQSHFQTVFKKVAGVTPMAYRRQVKAI